MTEHTPIGFLGSRRELVDSGRIEINLPDMFRFELSCDPHEKMLHWQVTKFMVTEDVITGYLDSIAVDFPGQNFLG